MIIGFLASNLMSRSFIQDRFSQFTKLEDKLIPEVSHEGLSHGVSLMSDELQLHVSVKD